MTREQQRKNEELRQFVIDDQRGGNDPLSFRGGLVALDGGLREPGRDDDVMEG